MASTTKRGRDSGTGQFIPIPQAKQHPRTTTVETIPTRKPAPQPSKPKGGK